MSIRFTPYTIPFSSSFAESASSTMFSEITPTTSSLSGYSLNAFGDTGSEFITTNAVYDPLSPNLGLVVS